MQQKLALFDELDEVFDYYFGFSRQMSVEFVSLVFFFVKHCELLAFNWLPFFYLLVVQDRLVVKQLIARQVYVQQ